MSSTSGKVAWNTGMQVLGKIITTGLGLLITVLLTRYLGPAGYGEYTFVLVFVTMFGSIADWGLYLVGVNEVSKYKEEESKIAGNILSIRLFLALIAAFFANVVIRVLPHSPAMESLIFIGSLFIVIFSLKTSLQIIFNARLKMEYWAISELAANLVGLALALYLIMNNASVDGFVWAMNFGQLASLIVAYIFASRLLKLQILFDSKVARRIIKEALPVGALLVVFSIYNRLDIIILGYAKGSEAVGFYGAAYKIYDVLVMGAAYFANAILPIFSRLAFKDMDRFGKIYAKSFVALFVMGFFVAVFNLILAPLAIFVIGGSEFEPAVLALRILSLAVFVSYFNHLNGYAIISMGKQWYSLIIAVVALIFNLMLNLILIPKFSLYGAALNTFLTEGLILVLSLIIIRRIGGLRFGFKEFFVAGREIYLKRFEYLNNLRGQR